MKTRISVCWRRSNFLWAPANTFFLEATHLKADLHGTIFAQHCRMQPAYNLSCTAMKHITHLRCRRLCA
jgi:hypothetical protein